MNNITLSKLQEYKIDQRNLQRITSLFPGLTIDQITEAIKKSKFVIRGKVPIKGETTMTFGYGTWKCDTCKKDTGGGYRTYCDGCFKKNISPA